MMTILRTLPLWMGVLFLASCGNPEPEPQDPLTPERDTTEQTATIEYALSPLPSPLQIALIFKSAGLTYVEDVTLTTDEKQRFISGFDKQLALGIYSADFTYSSLNGMKQEAEQYFITLEEIANDIGFGEAFNTQQNMERVRNNIDNLDSVGFLLAEIHMNADRYFMENGEQEKAYVIFAGAWLESMYLGAVTKDLESQPSVARCLLDQSDILTDLLMCIEKVGMSESEDLQNLHALLTDVDEKLKAITTTEEDGQDIVLQRDQLTALVSSLENARNAITKSNAE